MSNQRDEDFDSIYASIEDDDDAEEMYVDVSSTPPNEGYGGPSPYVYPQAPQPPSPSVRKLPPLPVKSTVGAASRPPWPRKAPQPPPNQPSVKIPKKPSSEPNRNVPQPLPRVGTVKKKEPAGKPAVKSRQAAQFQQQDAPQIGYNPPPPVITANSGYDGYQHYPQEVAATTATLKTRYQDSGFGSGRDEPHYKLEYAAREPPSSTGKKLLYHQPPPPNNPPPPPRGTSGQDFTGQILNTPTADESEYESLRPARQRLLRGFGHQNRRSHRYSDDRIPLQDMASDHEDSDRGYQVRREKEGGRGAGVQNNSRIVCILLTIIVIALLISLMSLVMSLYTLTRFELSRRVNNTASECDIKVSNCTADLSDVDCQRDPIVSIYYGNGYSIHVNINHTCTCNCIWSHDHSTNAKNGLSLTSALIILCTMQYPISSLRASTHNVRLQLMYIHV